MADVVAEKVFGIPLVDLPKYRVAEPVGTKPIEPHEGLNVALLDEILEFIKAHPTTWEQADWYRIVDRETGNAIWHSEIATYEEKNSCGTAFCFAGHVAIREGFPAPPKKVGAEWSREVDGERYGEYVDEFARKRLGLEHGQSDQLFDGSNSIQDIELMVNLLKDNPNVSAYDLEMVREYHDEYDGVDVAAYKTWLEDYDSLPHNEW